MDFGAKVVQFYRDFRPPENLPDGIELANPYEHPARRGAIEQFYAKFFSDEFARIHILGINPSRLNTTATGVNYTDGYALKNYCEIDNDFSQSRELTADFFYRVVDAMGGASTFYRRVFPWAMMPVTVTKEGNYANYYSNDILEDMKSLVSDNIRWLTSLPANGKLVILGAGENQKVFNGLPGSPFGYNEVVTLPHPRWIMQYNRNKIDAYIEDYVNALS